MCKAGNLTSNLDFYLKYDNENDFLEDHEGYKSMKEALLSVIGEIIDFLRKAIENKRMRA